MFVQCFEVVRHRVSAKYQGTALQSSVPIMKEIDAKKCYNPVHQEAPDGLVKIAYNAAFR